MIGWIRRRIKSWRRAEKPRFDHSESFSPEVRAWIEKNHISIHYPAFNDVTPGKNYSIGGHDHRDHHHDAGFDAGSD